MDWKSRRKRRDDPQNGHRDVREQTAYSVREKDLLGIDRGHKPPRDLCGEPRVLTPEEIAELGSKRPPRRWYKRKDRL